MITDLAVMSFDEDTCRMQVESLHPGVTFEQVQENTGFESGSGEADVEETVPPAEEELRLLRDEVDPDGLIIGR